MVQSEQHVINRLMAGRGREAQTNMGKAAMSGSSPQLTLMKGAPGDQV